MVDAGHVADAEPGAFLDCVDTDRYRPVHASHAGRRAGSIDRVPTTGDELARLARRVRAHRRLDVDTTVGPTEVGSLIALAAAGVRLVVPRCTQEAADLLGVELHQAVRDGFDDHDPMECELRSIRVRRAALTHHAPDARWSQIASALDVPPPSPRTISVLLASRRPADLQLAVMMVAAQTAAADVQLVVGLHGPGWDESTAASVRLRFDGDVVIDSESDDVPLGSLLDRMSARADGDLLVKWDDDDWYGVRHLDDLRTAFHYSGADIVGKAAEFVYLSGSDTTIRRSSALAESYSPGLAGGTLMIARSDLAAVGGWPATPKDVDRLLIERVLRHGGVPYRTHGFQYLLQRRAGSGAHTWSAGDEYFLAGATDRRSGLALDFADIDLPFPTDRPATSEPA